MAVSSVSPPGLAGNSGIQDVWQWRSDCAQPTILRIEIHTDAARLLETRLTLCRGPRDSGTARKTPITFPATRIADKLETSPETAVTGDVWVAGSEPDGVTLGVSFQTVERVLLNTLRFVPASGASQAEVVTGVRLLTIVEDGQQQSIGWGERSEAQRRMHWSGACIGSRPRVGVRFAHPNL